MAEVRFHGTANLDWERLGDLYPPEMRAALPASHADSAICTHEPGKDGSLHLQEFKFLPHAEVSLHGHDKAEIIYILEGSLKFGNRVMEPGSSVYVGEDTLYAFTAGDEGCRLLIFMATGVYQTFYKEDARQRATAG